MRLLEVVVIGLGKKAHLSLLSIVSNVYRGNVKLPDLMAWNPAMRLAELVGV